MLDTTTLARRGLRTRICCCQLPLTHLNFIVVPAGDVTVISVPSA
jgi:hypothetical protein